MGEILDIRSGETLGRDKEILKELAKPRTLKLSEHPSEVCPKCGSKLFTTAFVIKDVPGIDIGVYDMEKAPMPIEQYSVFVCAKCGELAPGMNYDKATKDVIDKLLGEDNKDNKE